MTPEYILSQLSFLEKLYYTPPPSYNTTQRKLPFHCFSGFPSVLHFQG